MMTVAWEPFGEGARITKLVSTDKDIVIPEETDGKHIVSVGPCFLKGCPGGNGKSLTVPGTVTDMDPEAISGFNGLVRMVYKGDISVFSSFGLITEGDLQVECSWDSKPFSFMFFSH